MSPVLLAVGGASLLAWLAIALDPARPWALRPREDELAAPDPPEWPAVAVLVPARNEARYLPRTLPALLAQDYPGPRRVLVVDDRSGDGTGELARGLGAEVVAGAELPDGWVGKVWALEQGAQAIGRELEHEVDYLLLTDADVVHARDSLRRLVAESEAAGLALNSRMARLRCRSAAEKLLIPAFLFFFNLLYPMRRANDPRARLAAAAGGCVLLRAETLDRIGGFAAIRGEVIDDINLARRVKALGRPVRLALSGARAESLREHDLGGVWRMVARTAFAELRYSWLRLAGTVAGLALLFAAPPATVGLALALGRPLAAAPGAAAWLLSAALYLPALRFFGLGALRALGLPLVGILYGGMTLDSALRRRGW